MKKRNKKLFVGGVIGFLLSLIVCVMVPFNRKDAVVNVSIDDVEYSFKNLYENPEYTSVFQQPFFAYLRDCHLKYNCTFTLYVYANMGGSQISLRKNLKRILIGFVLAFMLFDQNSINKKQLTMQSSPLHFCALIRF